MRSENNAANSLMQSEIPPARTQAHPMIVTPAAHRKESHTLIGVET
jgi:hypothetical protein